MNYNSLLFIVSISIVTIVSCHPQCLDYLPPFAENQGLTFCPEYSAFGCCTILHENEIKEKYDNMLKEIKAMGQVSSKCQNYMQRILCQECSPFASHLYDTETNLAKKIFPGLCRDYCLEFYEKCSHVIQYMTDDESVISASETGPAFCEYIRASDEDYCYPDILDDDVLAEELTTAIDNKDGCLCVEEFASNLVMPVLAVHAGDGSHRLFVGELQGIVHVYFKNGTKTDEPFLDMANRLLTSGGRAQGDERGLMGLAFHPNFKDNGRIFVSYVNGTEDPVTGKGADMTLTVSEMRISEDDENLVDASFERILLVIEEPGTTHNDGQLLFGPVDGFMYIFLGDGGSPGSLISPLGDPWGSRGNGQNLTSFQGSVLRIDIDSETGGKPYGIPQDNPFVDIPDAFPEIFAYGFRSLWRSSVDRGDKKTGEGRGRIFCGDVGHRRYEEIDIVLKGGNYGWRAKEGYACQYIDMCTDGSLGEDVEPIHVYNHTFGKAVIGGYVYRGCQSPNLYGRYIFGDYFKGNLFMLTENKTSGEWQSKDICMGDESICNNGLVGTYPKYLLSFGEDESGELYILSTSKAWLNIVGGKVLRIVDPSRRGNPEECLNLNTGSRPTASIFLIMTLMAISNFSTELIVSSLWLH
ncbi:HHIP-like protein 2 [Glandiceps talaboti]